MALTPDERLDALEAQLADTQAELAELVRLGASDQSVTAVRTLAESTAARVDQLERRLP